MSDERIHRLDLRQIGGVPGAATPLTGNGGGGTSGGMEERVAKLERDVGEIKSDLRLIRERLMLLPTKGELFNYLLASLAIGLAIMAIVIGGIIGGLSWIKPDSPAPAANPAASVPPMIIQVPAYPAPPTPAPQPPPEQPKP